MTSITLIETYLYPTVKIVGVAYLIYRVWVIVFRYRLFGLWDRLFAKPGTRMPRKEEKVTAAHRAVSVMGPAKHVILTDPRKREPEPVATTDLEQTGYIGEQEPVTADDVEIPEPPYIPSEDELDIPPPDDNAMSSGLSFEDLNNTVDVLKNGTRDEVRLVKAAKTAYDIQDTEIMDILVREVCGADDIESLITGCLDPDGIPLKKRSAVAGFRIEDYV